MRHYKDANDNVFGYGDYVTPPDGLTEITFEEAKAIANPEPTIEQEREGMAVTRYQARAALHNAGLLDDTKALMTDPATPEDIRIMWEYKDRIHRVHPAAVQMLDALGLTTDEQKDDLFRAGMAIEP